MNFFRFIVVLTTFAFCFSANASDVDLKRRLASSEIQNADFYVEDFQFDDLGGGNFTDAMAFSYVRLGIEEAIGDDYVSGDVEYKVDVKITPYNSSDVAQTALNETLIVTYNEDGVPEIDTEHDFRLPDFHKIRVEVTAQYIDGVSNTNFPDFVYLEAGFMAERYWELDLVTKPVLAHQFIQYASNGDPSSAGTGTTTSSTTDEIYVLWDFIDGAEMYELEWTWVDNYSESALATARAQSDIELTEQDFWHNSTRIRTSHHDFRIPNVFAKGYLIYRVRAVGVWTDDTDIEKFGKWSSDDGVTKDHVNDWPEVITIGTEHEGEKNWQYQATYAEEGKKKEVVQYFDGSLRSRQTVTRITSTNQSVVGETIYDNEGRGSVQILPVPQTNPAIQYYANLNRTSSTHPYSHQDFDWLDNTDPCEATVPTALYTGSGSGQYYSASAHTSDTDWQQYVPEASGFAFTQTLYTPDNTGRIRSQSGVGSDFTIGSGKETRYFYAQALQSEINRLFGFKVGYAQRYKKNMVVDGNGQVSVSYLDPQGRVVATALSGDAPSTFDKLPSEVNGTHLSVTNDLLNKVLTTDEDTDVDNNMLQTTGRFGALNDELVYEGQIVVANESNYTFDYEATSVHYEEFCTVNGVSYPYVYDLTLNLKDDCGTEIFSSTVSTLGTELIGSSTGDNITYSYTTTSPLAAGTYTLYKSLRINEEAMLNYMEDYLSDGNTCMLDTADFDIPDTDDCTTTCQECADALGSLESYLLSIETELGTTLTTQQEGEYEAAYDQLVANCWAPCEIATSCSAYEQGMLADLHPYGQYGLSSTDELSVYNTSNSLDNSYVTGDYNYTDPYTPYLDATGNPALITAYEDPTITGDYYLDQNTPNGLGTASQIDPKDLKLAADFMEAFQPSWAPSLLAYHPEYPLYDYVTELCTKTDDVTQDPSGTIALTSEEFDNILFTEINTYELAANDGSGNSVSIDFAGTTNPIYDRDPYFQQQYTLQNYSVLSANDAETLKKDIMFEAINTEYKNTGHTMLEYAYLIVMEGNSYATPPVYSTWTTIASNTTTEELDLVWQQYKSLYLATKKQIDQYFMDLHGYDNKLFNGCIGSGSADVASIAPFIHYSDVQDMYEHVIDIWNGSSSIAFPDHPALHPSVSTSLCSDLYDGKQIRVIRSDALIDESAPGDVYMAESEAEADYAMWQSTGLCPVAFDFQMLLHQMAGLNAFKGFNGNNANHNAFSAQLYEGLFGAEPVSGDTMILLGTVNGTSNNLEIEFDNQSTTCTIEFPDLTNINGTLDWDDYDSGTTGEWFVFDAYQTYPTGTYTAEIILLAGGTLEDAEEYVVEYTSTCLKINDCVTDYDTQAELDPNCDKEEQFEAAMLNLMQHVYIDGEFENTTGYNISTKGYYENTILPDVIGTSTANWVGPNVNDMFSVGTSSYNIEFDMDQSFPDVSTNPFMITSFHVLIDNPTSSTGDVYITVAEMNGTTTDLTGTYTLEHNSVSPTDLVLDCPCEEGVYSDYSQLAIHLENMYNDMLLNQTAPNGTTPASLAALDQFTTIDMTSETVTSYVHDEELSFTISPSLKLMNLELPVGVTSTATLEYITGGAYDPNVGFTATGHYNDGSTEYLLAYPEGPTWTTGRAPCDTCTPTPLQPVSCQDAYDDYTTALNSVSEAVAISESDFCAGSYAYIIDGYTAYLDDMGIASIEDIGYLTLSEFGMTSIGYNDAELTSAVTAYIADNRSDTTSAEYMTWNNFVSLVYQLENVVCPVLGLPDPIVFGDTLLATPCDQWENNINAVNSSTQYENFLNAMADAFQQAYIEGAMSSVVEEMEESHDDKEYHYTLYYYDRAGNLSQTIPPKGVKRFEAGTANQFTNDQINAFRESDPDAIDNVSAGTTRAPEHTYGTIYRYNSLNQLVYQATPDGGVSRFAYDALGRLVVSQNAKQDGDDQYSYTSYDDLGRVVEVGEMDLTGHEINDIGRLIITASSAEADVNDPTFPANLSPTSREEVTLTIYDELKDDAGSDLTINVINNFSLQTNTDVDVADQFEDYASDNTRNRIVGVVYQETYNGNDINDIESGIYYDYDVHGNVKELIQVYYYDQTKYWNQHVKNISYSYDLVSGNVNEVTYQKGGEDQFIHYYEYDADNRIIIAETSKDGILFEKDAKYFYYDHGPLARTELSDAKSQALDYAYTIQGWIKTVNGENVDEETMMGHDGDQTVTTLNRHGARDVFGYSLNYYEDDYAAATTDMLAFSTNLSTAQQTSQHGSDLFNGNIQAMYTALSGLDEVALSTHQTKYGYDQLNRIKSMEGYNVSTGSPNPTFDTSGYSSAYDFDANGNLEMLERYAWNGSTSVQMDDFEYKYEESTTVGGTNNNQLSWVDDQAGASVFSNADIDDVMNAGNYDYDEIGQLISDADEGIELIEWKVTNKVERITYDSGNTIDFDYDPMGNRIAKHSKDGSNITSTFYILDAQGNQMTTYTIENYLITANPAITLSEQMIYGSSRVAVEATDEEMGYVEIANPTAPTVANYYQENAKGDKRFELSNHLGNVLNVVTDRVLPVSSGGGSPTIAHFLADVVSYSDYYPYGMVMPNKHGSDNQYRYGFQGQEKDDEVKGNGNSVNYKYRMHDPRIGRFFAVDPLAREYPHNSPYNFSENMVIHAVELEGLEAKVIITDPVAQAVFSAYMEPSTELAYAEAVLYASVLLRSGNNDVATFIGDDNTSGFMIYHDDRETLAFSDDIYHDEHSFHKEALINYRREFIAAKNAEIEAATVVLNEAKGEYHSAKNAYEKLKEKEEQELEDFRDPYNPKDPSVLPYRHHQATTQGGMYKKGNLKGDMNRAAAKARRQREKIKNLKKEITEMREMISNELEEVEKKYNP